MKLNERLNNFRTRLATVEAERDAAQKRMQDCEARMMRYAIELAEMQAERDALAAQNVRLREALERLTTITEADNVDSYMLDVHEGERVLAIGKPQAARDVAEWRRDSERYRYIRTASLIHWEEGEKHNRISWPTIYAAERIAGGNYRDRFDAAIDAAIDAARGGGQ